MTYNFRLAVGIILCIFFIAVIWPIGGWRYDAALFLYVFSLGWGMLTKTKKP